MKLRVVTTRQLCSACHIIESVVRQMIEKQLEGIEGIDVEWKVYETMQEAIGYPLLEVPKFPSIFINDEQVSAGEIPSREEFKRWSTMIN